MQDKKPPIFMRFAGLLTLSLLGLAALAYGLLTPNREQPGDLSPRAPIPEVWPAEVEAALQNTPDMRAVRCTMRPEFSSVARMGTTKPGAVLVREESELIAVVARTTAGAIAFDEAGQPVAWASFSPECALFAPLEVQVQGRVLSSVGDPVGDRVVDVCGVRAQSDASGAFSAVLPPMTLGRAEADMRGLPSCSASAGDGPVTPIDLSRPGPHTVVVQVD